MSIATSISAPRAISRVNPVTKLVVSLIIGITLLLSIDTVSAGVALVLELLLVPLVGVSARVFWLRTAPLWLSAPFAGITTVLYGVDSGAVLAQFWFVSITEGSVESGIAIAIRVLAIGLPGVLLLATTDPTDLADGLSQILHLPARFVLGGLAGLRLVGLLFEDWRALGLARRARGVGGAGGIVATVKDLLSRSFGLLVLAIRRGTRLATAMEAKGFGADAVRTWARPSSIGPLDAVVILIGIIIGAAAVSSAALAGTWSFILA